MDVSLSLTHACNLGCRYCYAGPKDSRAMSQETAIQALEFAFSFKSPRLQLGFFGGEPLLAWDLLRECTERAEAMAERRGVRLVPVVTTNGTLVSRENAAWLRDHAFHLGVSVDGHRGMHDRTRPLAGGGSSFDACLRGLELCLEAVPETEVIMVLDPANVSHCVEGVRYLAEEKRVRRISINPNFHTHWPEPALMEWQSAFRLLGDFYLERYRANRPIYLSFIDAKITTRLKKGYETCDRCDFGEREIAVAPSGRIYPCERLIGDDTQTEMCIGSVTGGFDEERRARILRRRGNRNPECLGCHYRARCMNWCCCINYTVTGLIDRTDGTVCFHERNAIQVADAVGNQLFAERNPAFLGHFYRDIQGTNGSEEDLRA